MSAELSGNIVFDTGPLIEIVSGSKAGAYAKKLLQSGAIRGFTNEINLAELQYLICRQTSEEKSEEAIDVLRNSELFQISSFQEYATSAANMKCRRVLSLADCFALSLGEFMKFPVLFASQEAELMKEIRTKAFETKILFLDDLTQST